MISNLNLMHFISALKRNIKANTLHGKIAHLYELRKSAKVPVTIIF